MALWVPNKTAIDTNDVTFGVCLWELPNGVMVQDGQQNYLSAQGQIGDPVKETKMRAAARELGITEGRPVWRRGFRKITQNEWDDQMEMTQEGHNADPVDVYRQIEYGI